MFVFKQQCNCNSESSGIQQTPLHTREHMSNDSGEQSTHSGMYASELEIFTVIVDIYFLTYTYILSSLNGRACSSGG
jgi:hypothetical protein